MELSKSAKRVASISSVHSPQDNSPPSEPTKLFLESDSNNTTTKKSRSLGTVKLKVKQNAKKLLGVSQSPCSSDDDLDGDDQILRSVSRDPAFHPTDVERRLEVRHAREGGPVERVAAGLSRGVTAVAHPRRTAVNKFKRTAAGKISTPAHGLPPVQRPDIAYIEYERALLRESSRNRKSSTTSLPDPQAEDNEAVAARSKLLEEQRESLRVAWTTARTKRVRVVPRKNLHFPVKGEYKETDEGKCGTRIRWLDWTGKLLLYYTQDFSSQYVDDFEALPFDIDTLRSHVERLIMASSSWQTWIMDMRSIYRWEDPWRTARFLAIYSLFWYNNYVMSYFWGWLMYKIVYNKLYSTSLPNLRAATRRAVDRETVAFQLGEMVDRHGREEWIDPFLAEVGPFVQVQVNDLVNMLEVLSNFHRWKSPYRTASSLLFFVVCFLTSVSVSMEYSMKIVWFILGGTFFFCWPIASLYPRYRLLVSPVKWVLWGIPTHAEWSFQYLRYKAQIAREAMIRKQVEERHKVELNAPPLQRYAGNYDSPTTNSTEGDIIGHETIDDSEDYESATSTNSILSGADIIGFKATFDGLRGRLVVYPTGIRFIRSLSNKEIWRLPFLELSELWKAGKTRPSKFHISYPGRKGRLFLRSTDGQVRALMSVRERDECFNSIIGHSGLQWQSLQSVFSDSNHEENA